MSFQRLLNTPVYSGKRADLPAKMTEGATYITTDTKEIFVTGEGEIPFVASGLSFHCYNMTQNASGILFNAATIATGLDSNTKIENSVRIGVGVNHFDIKTTGANVVDLSIGSRLLSDGETKASYILSYVGEADTLGQRLVTYKLSTYIDGVLSDFVLDETSISFKAT